jgi:hypothetical protein
MIFGQSDMTLLDTSTLTLLLMLVLMALTLGTAVGWIVAIVREARLPAATRLADVDQRLTVTQEALDRKQLELREIDQKIADRDRLAAEAAALREQIEELRAQLAGLEPAREDIAATLKDAADAAGKLEAARTELSRVQSEIDVLRRELDPERISRLKAEQANAQRELDRLLVELGPLRAERDAALRIIAEGAQQTARAEGLTIEIARLDHERQQVEARLDALRAETAGIEATRQELTRLRDAISAARQSLEIAQEQEVRCAARAESLQAELEEIADVRDTVRAELALVREERDSIRNERNRAIEERDAALLLKDESRAARDALAEEAQQLETRIALLKDDLKGLLANLQTRAPGQAPVGPLGELQRKALVADLVAQPACLATPAQLRGEAIQEPEALHRVRTYLQGGGLLFSDRVLRAFHTALKINDSSQITVLAGVSGTGKSLLPRRYAEAMGIHFLQVAVEPRWDSPQDLLGFYNYVEGKYRATELARLMVSMDPWRSFGAEAPNHRDRLAMVLLDEMNLARVEYYFSEFLSRLEVRPPYAGGWPDRAACKDALIPVDIRGLENPPSLFPGQNILFVGTMNDDESTQSLSDKVLDRGNVMQFPAPSSFPAAGAAVEQEGADALPFQSWRSWVRPPSALGEAPAARVAEVVRRLAVVMDAFGKPFGHRMNQSIRHYVANYPTETGQIDIDAALADQIELRILPKLRGVEIANHLQQFDDLEQLIGETLGDTAVANRLKDLRADQEGRTGQFVWRGLARG